MMEVIELLIDFGIIIYVVCYIRKVFILVLVEC